MDPLASSTLIVGLGNPGREYASTRHNLGWIALDELVQASEPRHGCEEEVPGRVRQGHARRTRLRLSSPRDVHERIGAQRAAGDGSFFHVAPRDVIVLHDELDLPFGDVRVKFGGGHAGHNGLRSLVQHLGTPDFVRVRMGVGRPPAGFAGEVADYSCRASARSSAPSLPDIVDKGVQSGAQGSHRRRRARHERSEHADPSAAGRRRRRRGTGGSNRQRAPPAKRVRVKSSREA